MDCLICSNRYKRIDIKSNTKGVRCQVSGVRIRRLIANKKIVAILSISTSEHSLRRYKTTGGEPQNHKTLNILSGGTRPLVENPKITKLSTLSPAVQDRQWRTTNSQLTKSQLTTHPITETLIVLTLQPFGEISPVRKIRESPIFINFFLRSSDSNCSRE